MVYVLEVRIVRNRMTMRWKGYALFSFYKKVFYKYPRLIFSHDEGTKITRLAKLSKN